LPFTSIGDEVVALAVGFAVGRLFRLPFTSIGDEVVALAVGFPVGGGFACPSPASATKWLRWLSGPCRPAVSLVLQ
jgi:hypothetical protein